MPRAAIKSRSDGMAARAWCARAPSRLRIPRTTHPAGARLAAGTAYEWAVMSRSAPV